MANRQDRRRDKRLQNQEFREQMKTAMAHLDNDRVREAELAFKEAAAMQPGEAEPHHMLAMMTYRAGRLEEAGNHIVEAAMRDDDDVAIHADCGAIMNMLGRPAEAEAACRHVIDQDPDHVEAYNNLSVALSMQGKRDEALEICEAALARRPDYTDALVNKANLLVKMDDTIAAIEAFAAAIQVAPENPLARVNLGIALRMVGELDAAEEQCRLSIELRPDYPEAHAGLGMVLAAKEDFAAAIKAFREALKLRPGFAAAQLNLAAAHFKAGDFEASEAVYCEIIEQHPAAAPAQTGLGVVMLASGRLDAATQAFRDAVDLDPREGEAWMNLSSALGSDMPDADIAQMTDFANNMLLSTDQRVAIRFALGEVCDRRGEFEAAFVHYRAGNDARKAELNKLGKIFDPAAIVGDTEAVQSIFNPSFIERFAGIGDLTERPVFIIGMPRSGTTLVEQILASHPDVNGAGEIGCISATVPNFPDSITDLDVSQVSAMARNAAENLFVGAGEAARVIDKAPFQFQHLGLIRILFPNARIIHCVRDPLDIGLSCYFQNFVADYPWSADLGHIGVYLQAYSRLMDHWRTLFEDAILDVRYETLVENQEAESRRLINHLGLPWHDECLNFHETRRTVLTASNWSVRKPIHTRSIARAASYGGHTAALRKALE